MAAERWDGEIATYLANVADWLAEPRAALH
jgi:hypothetical protein